MNRNNSEFNFNNQNKMGSNSFNCTCRHRSCSRFTILSNNLFLFHFNHNCAVLERNSNIGSNIGRNRGRNWNILRNRDTSQNMGRNRLNFQRNMGNNQNMGKNRGSTQNMGRNKGSNWNLCWNRRSNWNTWGYQKRVDSGM